MGIVISYFDTPRPEPMTHQRKFVTVGSIQEAADFETRCNVFHCQFFAALSENEMETVRAEAKRIADIARAEVLREEAGRLLAEAELLSEGA